MNHNDKLSKYAVITNVLYIDDMIRLMTEKGIEITISILIEENNSFPPPHVPFSDHSTRVA